MDLSGLFNNKDLKLIFPLEIKNSEFNDNDTELNKNLYKHNIIDFKSIFAKKESLFESEYNLNNNNIINNKYTILFKNFDYKKEFIEQKDCSILNECYFKDNDDLADRLGLLDLNERITFKLKLRKNKIDLILNSKRKKTDLAFKIKSLIE